MPYYYVNSNQQPITSDHEVHQATGCPHPVERQNRLDLGFFSSCHGAVAKARLRYPHWRINGCAYYSPECHTT